MDKKVSQINSEADRPNSQTKPEVTESAIDLQEQVRCRAYELYEKRGKEDGHEIDDWVQAESEVTAGTTKAAA
jgi:Protein of unknown function (DUF2934)